MRLLLLCCVLLTSVGLRADDLSDRLRLLVPGSAAAAVNERQYLYQQVTELFGELEREEKVHRKRKKKRIRRIRDYLGEKVLLQYEASATITDVFQTGRYNYATASVLAALCFEKYEIAYAGYVDHWKAYLIADPVRRSINIYYGDPNADEAALKRSYRQDYLQLARETVGPNLPDLNGDAAANAFYDYHYRPSHKLTFTQLAAYAHFTNAQAEYAGGRHGRAIELAEAALALENRTPFLVILEAAKIQLKAKVSPEVVGDMGALFFAWHEDPLNGYIPAAILQNFDEEQRLLLASNEAGLTRNLLETYLAKAPTGHEEWRIQMEQLQQLRLLEHHHKQGDHPAAMGLAEKLYIEYPDDERFTFLLGEIVVSKLRKDAATSEALRQQMVAAALKYPFLNQHPRFIDLYLRQQALRIRDLYAEERPELAGAALDKFRASLASIDVGEDRSLWTLTAFAAASYYHFTIEDYRGAVKYIEEALQYAPQDRYLIHRLSVLEKYL